MCWRLARALGLAAATALLAGCITGVGPGNGNALSTGDVASLKNLCLSIIRSDTNPVPPVFSPKGRPFTEVFGASLAVVYRTGRRVEWCFGTQGGGGLMGSYETWHQRNALDVLSAVYLKGHIWSLLLVSPRVSRLQIVAPETFVQVWRDGPRVELVSINHSSIPDDAQGAIAAAEVVGFSADKTVVAAEPIKVCPMSAESFFNLCGVSRKVSLSQLWSTPL